ncbi:beta-amyrin 11-oxidase-like [Fagus crenata]
MELDFLWWIVAALLGSYVFIFWFVKRVNEWYYHVGKLGETACHLPPRDMGWPFLGNMLPLFKTLRSCSPNTFIYSLVSRYGKTGIYKAHMFGSPSIIVCTPEICRRVLTNDEHFTIGYPKSVYLLSGRRSLHAISNVEHRRLRRLIGSPIKGHEALTMYIKPTDDIVINSLDEWASLNEPFEFYTEIKRATFKIKTQLCMGSIKDSTLWTLQNLHADYRKGLMSMAINIPGFAFHKALKKNRQRSKIHKIDPDLQQQCPEPRTQRVRRESRVASWKPLKRGNLQGESVETEEATMLEHREEEAAMWDAEGFKYEASSISFEDPPFLYCFLELRALNHM